ARPLLFGPVSAPISHYTVPVHLASEFLMTEQHQPEKSIFLAAIEISSTAERTAFLEKACAGSPSLRGEVEAPFQAPDRPHPLLDAPVAGAPTMDEPQPSERPGGAFGPYQLLEQLGEGGFGVVFRAEQTQPGR